jgi:DNA-binding NarL/FixJ family response regulator
LEGKEVAVNVLVVDNSAVLCAGIIGLLSSLRGITLISEAHDAQEAWRAIEELQPDVVTLDIQLSGGCGIKLLKRIKQQQRAPVVIVLSHSSSLQYRNRSKEAGADFFLDKATEWTQLKILVQNLLNGVFEERPVNQTSGGNK